MRTRILALPLAALLLAATACGTDTTDPVASPSPTPTVAATSSPDAMGATSDDGLPDEPPGTFTPSSPSPTSTPSPIRPVSPEPEPEPEPTSAPAPEPEPEPEPSDPPPPAAPAQAAVTIADFDYSPDPVEVAVGGTITWTNQDSTAHTATVSGGPDTGAIRGGESASLTFDAAGTYDYVCQFHPGSMTGTVVVR